MADMTEHPYRPLVVQVETRQEKARRLAQTYYSMSMINVHGKSREERAKLQADRDRVLREWLALQ